MRSMTTILRKGTAYRLYGEFREDASYDEVHRYIFFNLTRLNHQRQGLLSDRYLSFPKGWVEVPDNEVPEVIRARAIQVRRRLAEHPFLGRNIINGTAV